MVDLDAWLKLRALELLDESVRLFTKRGEIRVQQSSADELEESLTEKL